MPGPTNRHATRWIIDRLEALLGDAPTFDPNDPGDRRDQADREVVDMAAERLRELNALAAQAYVGIPPARHCVTCGQDRRNVRSLHMRYVDLVVRARKLEHKLVLRAARLGRERARHEAERRELEAVAIDHAVKLEAGIRLARQMMNTPGQTILGTLVYRTLGGRDNVQQ